MSNDRRFYEGALGEESRRSAPAALRNRDPIADVLRDWLPGSGLGLAMASAAAKAMGGDLTVDSAPGAGARFELSLPLA